MSAPVIRYKKIETLFSLAVMAGLVVIGLIIIGVQDQFYPAVINLTPAHDDGGVSSPRPINDQPIIPSPTGMRTMSEPERFDTDTLSNKINGKAELYLSAGFIELHTQRFQMTNNETMWFELYLYNMGTPSNAFAVFSTQRRQDVEKFPFAQHAYGTGNAIFFTNGSYYVEMIASTSGPAVLAMLIETAKLVLAQLGGDIEPSEEKSGSEQLFPVKDQVSDSLALIAKDAFGFNRLDQVYTTQYQTSETDTTLFISARSSIKEAADLATAYSDFLVEFGGVKVHPPLASVAPEDRTDKPFLIIDILDSIEIVFSVGPYLAGVHMGEGMDTAIEHANRLYRHLSELAKDQTEKKGP
jgi:hypothetical protein